MGLGLERAGRGDRRLVAHAEPRVGHATADHAHAQTGDAAIRTASLGAQVRFRAVKAEPRALADIAASGPSRVERSAAGGAALLSRHG